MNVKSLDNIAEDLFNKIRGRFPSVTIGNENGEITNDPLQARFFDFDFKEGDKNLGKVSISVSEDAVSVMYTSDFVENEDTFTKDSWYNFLKEIRTFAKKRLLKFDTRDITKSNLNRRDYQFLAQKNTGGEVPMSESKLYGTSKVSYQDIGSARLNIRHKKPVNPELAASRTQNIDKVYIESSEGERFMYPYRHLAGARAMARHVAEGGKPFDDFGKHITGLSEELSKIRKFKNYINRSSVMAEGLTEYAEVIESRIEEVKTKLSRIQKPRTYTEEFDGFEAPVFEDVPDEVAENWIEQLTIKQFNEELKDVFPYIYNLVKEATRAKELGPEDFLGEAPVDDVEVGRPAETYTVQRGDTLYSIYMKFKDANFAGYGRDEALQAIMDENPDIEDPSQIQPGMEIKMPYFMGATADGATRGLPPGGFQKYESELERSFEEMMGQFSESDDEETDEGNKFSGELEKARKQGKDEMEIDGEKIPVTEFVLSYFDRHTGQFPKGETAVLTMVEKEYGDAYIEPAKQFIEAINNKIAEMNGYKDNEIEEGGIGSHALANTELGQKIANFFGDAAHSEYGLINLLRKAQLKFGPAIYDKMGLSDEEIAKIQQDLEADLEVNESNPISMLKGNSAEVINKLKQQLMPQIQDALKNGSSEDKALAQEWMQIFQQAEQTFAEDLPAGSKARRDNRSGVTRGPDDGTRGSEEPANSIDDDDEDVHHTVYPNGVRRFSTFFDQGATNLNNLLGGRDALSTARYGDMKLKAYDDYLQYLQTDAEADAEQYGKEPLEADWLDKLIDKVTIAAGREWDNVYPRSTRNPYTGRNDESEELDGLRRLAGL